MNNTMRLSQMQAILAKATEDKETGCWLVPAGADGYGINVRLNGKTSRPHRAVYEFLFGPAPEGLQMDHLCRTRNCVNPMHMEPVTSGENTRRGVSANREKTHCPQGHPYDRVKKGRTHDSRACSICDNARARERYAMKRRALTDQ